MDINGTAMVWVTVTIFEKPMTCQLPVMNHKNQAIENPNAFQVNTAIMRCMTKALSLHGLGLYIYAGEDLPEEEGNAASKTMKKAPIITPNQGAGEDLTAQEKEYLENLSAELIDLINSERSEDAKTHLHGQNLENEQKLYLWSLLPSNVRSALKKK